MSTAAKSNTDTRIVGNYIILHKIGHGSFATVYKAKHKDTQQTVAIKSVLKSRLTKKLLENLESEISILTSIRHRHIVGLIECQKTESHIYLVMEYCSLGDLSVYIKEIRGSKATRGSAGGLPENVVRHFLKQLANALQFLRSKNLVHRDIKPQNLLLIPSSDPHALPILKVADFGFARFLPNASLAETLCGSPLYMGPEILSHQKYDAKADLWSVGSVLYEMITGKTPFRAENHLDLLKKIQDNNDRIHFPDEKDERIVIGSDLKDLIRKLLKKSPTERLSFEEFFIHPAVLQQEPLHTSISSPTVQMHRSRPNSRLVEVSNKAYEPPPFAINRHTSIERRWSTPRRLVSNENISPLYSGNRTANVESSSPSELHKSGTYAKRDEEDMLRGYVVVDRNSIQTNQFADALDALPRNGRRTSAINISKTNAMNIPYQHTPSTPPFVRERKVSTGTGASALAKAISMASVRLFGTSIPSPPKDQPHLIGSPRGFIPEEMNVDRLEDDTIQEIENLACMAHSVAKYGDQKYELFMNNKGDISGEEAVVLYIKALALLEKGLHIAQHYWEEQENDESERKNILRLNDAVQWMRDRFNECLDKAETVKRDGQTVDSGVEKLLYDRALEMSRAAAVHELVGENLTGCEQDYQTAIWMLDAILQVRPKGDTTIDEDDRCIVNNFIHSIRHRISKLRKKMEVSERI
ncbi:kinase-like domain-containing protein [Pilobolus umbonatus]|nr:kinase-like domain-containing protein [Pilobolus umbonatus]